MTSMMSVATSGSVHRAPVGTATPTVDGRLVHKTSPQEVYLTSWSPLTDTIFIVGAEWPEQHSFYAPTTQGTYDPLLVGETLRQAVILVAHVGFEVPMSSHFAMNGLTVRVSPEWLDVAPGPAQVSMTLTCHGVRRANGVFRGMVVHASFHRDGRLVGSGVGDLVVLPTGTYERMRGERTPLELSPVDPGLPPASVGRDRAQDVCLIAEGPGRYAVRVDTAHPVLFDHRLDHIPGMLVLEAARQAFAAHRGTDLPIGAVQATFTTYAELDQHCTAVVVDLPGDDRHAPLLVRFEQAGVEVATVLVSAHDTASVDLRG